MKFFETTVEYEDEQELVYVYLTGAKALGNGRGRAKKTITADLGLDRRVNVDLDQLGQVVGVELVGFKVAR